MGHGQRQRLEARRVASLVVALLVLIGVWVVGGRVDGAVPVLPDTTSRFSLDLEVVGGADSGLVYAVEQRARPYYRIFAFDPRTGAVETVHTVEEDAIIFDIALAPEEEVLAVGYSPDFAIEGSGISLLDPATGVMDQVVAASTGVYLTDLQWAPDGGSVLATRVDRTGPAEALSAVRVDVVTGSMSVVLSDAVNPVQLGDDVYALPLDEDNARRTIARVDDDGATTVLPLETGGADLDHLLADAETGSLRVAVLEGADVPAVTIGAAAEAHGNHDSPSTWWTIPTDDPGEATPLPWEPTIVYDAAISSGGVAYATIEGISVGGASRIDVIESRAIRFVTG